jgi:sedoheptulokinase
LYTWQDGRGNREIRPGVTYAAAVSVAVGRPQSTGMGLVTHLFNVRNRLVPAGAAALCTIADYAVMKLARRAQPVMDPTNGASLGGFDLTKLEFQLDAITALGLDPAIFPRVAATYPGLGETTDGTPVFTALGDNQASFLGSVSPVEGSLLVNVGTGSQLSLFMTERLDIPGIDMRPFPLGGCIGVGAALCGGKAWSILHEFFDQTLRLFTGQEGGASWEVMNSTTPQNAPAGEPLAVDTRFAGTRAEPGIRGAIRGINTRNFTPENLIAGVREGIAHELLGFLEKFPAGARGSIRNLVGSGNGIRLNPALRKVFTDRLGMEMRVPAHREETSFGAALLAAVACGALPDLGAAGRLISYR